MFCPIMFLVSYTEVHHGCSPVNPPPKFTTITSTQINILLTHKNKNSDECNCTQVLVFRLLVGLTKGNPTLSRRPALLAVLKEGKKFLQAFLRSISVLEQAFQANQGTVLEIFTHLQVLGWIDG